MTLDRASKGRFSPLFEPKPAWMAILGLVFLTTLGTLAGGASVMRLFFPVGAFGVGLFLYQRYPILYHGFFWWLWFVTPFLARIIDYRVGWDPSRLILVAPYFVALLYLPDFLRDLPKARSKGALPLVLPFVAVCYGLLLGLINGTPVVVLRNFLDWILPIPYSFHLLANWRDYPKYRQNFQRVFLWGILVMGTYGIYQYIVAPEWDRSWLIESGMFASAGNPEPFEMRIWSTMNSPGVFAGTMQAGLLLLLTSQGALRLPAAVVGILAFLMTFVRSCWGAFLIAILVFIPSLKQQLQMRLFATVLALVICIVPLAAIEPFASKLNTRLETISNLEQDGSYQDRKVLFELGIQVALSEYVGQGIGSGGAFDPKTGKWVSASIDNGLLVLLFTLGWLGTILYMGGLIPMLINVMKVSEVSFDPFMSGARALAISYCSLLIFGGAIAGISGVFLWGFLSITMAGNKYYQNQCEIDSKNKISKTSLKIGKYQN
jgi:O-Antigen ligase